jgi:pimeloyl-ACP methyl ester carboxylesterase
VPASAAEAAAFMSTLLMLHGIGSSGTSWARSIARLKDAFRCIAPDLPGYGDAPDPTGEPSLDTFVEFAAQLAAGVPVHVVGVSFGALIGLALTRRHPGLVRSLVVADATLGRAMLPPAEREGWLAGRLALGVDLPARADERAREIAGPAASADVLAEIAANMRRARPAGYAYVARVIARTDATPWLGELRVPALVVCGQHDGVVGLALSRTIAERLPGSRLETIARAGHAPHVEEPDAFAAAVRTFVAGVEAAAV